jgi:hypothetical protein
MAGKKTISKMEGVRRALAALGHDAMPVNIQTYVKTNFGLDMSTAHVSNYKTDILRKQSGKASKTVTKPLAKKSAVKKAPKAPLTPMTAPMSTTNSHASGIALTDIETVKGLVGRVGGHDLKSLIELFSK